MRLPEQRVWDDLRVAMGNLWFARRVEDRLGAGVADVTFAIGKRRAGWLELKQLMDLPSERRKFDFALDHFTPDQRGFGLAMRDAGGITSWWLLTRTGPREGSFVDHLHNSRIIDDLGEINYATFRNRSAWIGRLTHPDSGRQIAAALSARSSA